MGILLIFDLARKGLETEGFHFVLFLCFFVVVFLFFFCFFTTDGLAVSVQWTIYHVHIEMRQNLLSFNMF